MICKDFMILSTPVLRSLSAVPRAGFLNPARLTSASTEGDFFREGHQFSAEHLSCLVSNQEVNIWSSVLLFPTEKKLSLQAHPSDS